MLHTKLCGNLYAGSGKIFKRVLPYIGIVAILVTCDQHHVEKKNHFLVPKTLHTKSGLKWLWFLR